MKVSINPKYKPLSVLFLFTFISAALSFGASLLGELVIPFAAAALALLYVTDVGKRRIFTAITTAVIILTDIFLHGATSYVGVEVCVLALVIALAVAGNLSKAETSFWLSLITVLFFLVASVIALWSATGEASVDGYFDYYIGLCDALREVFVDSAVTAAENTPYAKIITEESAVALFNSCVSLLPAMLMVIAFAISGIALKLFSGALGRIADSDTRAWLSEWRFGLSGIVTAAFWVLVVVNLFTASSDSVGAVVAANLYTVFMVLHAYIGLKVVNLFFSRVFRNRAFAFLTVAGILLFLNSLAIELLAYFGAANLFFAKGHGNGDN